MQRRVLLSRHDVQCVSKICEWKVCCQGVNRFEQNARQEFFLLNPIVFTHLNNVPHIQDVGAIFWLFCSCVSLLM
jgi:hypothetical protein